MNYRKARMITRAKLNSRHTKEFIYNKVVVVLALSLGPFECVKIEKDPLDDSVS